VAKRRTIELTDPRALRAVAHPTRLKLVGLLRREGALTATQAGEHIGESAASCSFHLRQLAKYGLVEEAGGGRGRERPWRATASFTTWPSVAHDPELAAASQLLNRVVLERYAELIGQWNEEWPDDDPAWQEAASFGDVGLRLTREQLAGLMREVEALLMRYAEQEAETDDARLVSLIYFGFPTPRQ
jgi:DNA-binding transcriptional ArsR family regulator